jgi:hypothetical protein
MIKLPVILEVEPKGRQCLADAIGGGHYDWMPSKTCAL